MSFWDDITGHLDNPDTASALLGAGAQTTGAAVDPQVPNPSMEPGGYLWNSADAISRLPADMQRLFAHAQEAPLETAGSVLSSLPASRLGAEGASLLSSGAALGAGAIRAFHGSPHLFDRFRIGDNLLRGEGTNYIAPGGYFAGNERVAQSYRDIDMMVEHTLQQHGVRVDPGDLREVSMWATYPTQGRNSRTMQELADALARNVPGVERLDPAARLALMRDLQTQRGHMYEVNLNVEPNQLLDWDALLRNQSPEVADVLRRDFSETANALPSSATGRSLYRSLAERLPPFVYSRPGATPGAPPASISTQYPGAAAAAGSLRDAGIPGIQYFDQGSRTAQAGSRNYVVFPGQDELIQIMRRYGILGPTVVGTGAALLGQDE